MGISIGIGIDVRDQLTLLTPDGQSPHFITIEREYERIDGGALEALVAHTSNPDYPTIRWQNPFRSLSSRSIQWHDDEIGVASCLMSLVNAVRNNTAPTYGAEQARLDQEIVLALQKSANASGIPVKLPLDLSQVGDAWFSLVCPDPGS